MEWDRVGSSGIDRDSGDRVGSSEIEWDSMGSNGIEQDPIGSAEIEWDQVGPIGIEWDRMGLSRMQWDRVEWNRMGSSGNILDIGQTDEKSHTRSTTCTSFIFVSYLKRSLATATGVRQQPQSFWGREEKKLRSNI